MVLEGEDDLIEEGGHTRHDEAKPLLFVDLSATILQLPPYALSSSPILLNSLTFFHLQRGEFLTERQPPPQALLDV